MRFLDLEGVRIAILATDGFEESELIEPMKHWFRAGADLDVISPGTGRIRAMRHMEKGRRVNVAHPLHQVSPDNYHALLIPGGLFSPDALRTNQEVLRFVRAFDEAHKPIATICHGPQVLISAGLVKGRHLTGWKSIRTDIENAGGTYHDDAVVKDDNWISSRSPQDLPRFIEAGIDLILEHRRHAKSAGRKAG